MIVNIEPQISLQLTLDMTLKAENRSKKQGYVKIKSFHSIGN